MFKNREKFFLHLFLRILLSISDFLLYRFENNMFNDGFFYDRKKMFGNMYCFEIVLFCDMYRLGTYRLMTYCYVTNSLCDVPLRSYTV
jgi:hypothetical protein